MERSIVFLKSGLSRWDPSLGGLEKACYLLARFFQSAGYQVTILTTDWPHAKDVAPGLCVESLGTRARTSWRHLVAFDRQCRAFIEAHPEALTFGMDRNFCTQHFYRAGNGVHAAYLESRKAYSSWLKRASFRINPQHRLILEMERATFESPHLRTLFTNSEMVRGEIARFYPKVDMRKVVVVHNGVEWTDYAQPFARGFQERAALTRDLGLDNGCHQFLFVGHEYQRKGLSLLMKALACLLPHSFQLSVVGRERRMGQFKEEAARLGLGDRVRFFGAVRNVHPHFQVADSLVIPSLYDPFANVTVEGLAFGLFVISSAKNGGAEVLTPDTGRVFHDLHEPEELASCLREAVEQSKSYESAQHIRDSVAHLDVRMQLQKIAAHVAQ